jgi:hypothetical protein
VFWVVCFELWVMGRCFDAIVGDPRRGTLELPSEEGRLSRGTGGRTKVYKVSRDREIAETRERQKKGTVSRRGKSGEPNERRNRREIGRDGEREGLGGQNEEETEGRRTSGTEERSSRKRRRRRRV